MKHPFTVQSPCHSLDAAILGMGWLNIGMESGRSSGMEDGEKGLAREIV